MKRFFLFVGLVFTWCTHHTTAKSTLTLSPHDEKTIDLSITIPVPEQAYLYKDYITVSVDNPAITLSDWTITNDVVSHYDPLFKTTKKVFKHDVTLFTQAHINGPISHEAQLHVAYYLSSNKGIIEESFPLTGFAHLHNADASDITTPDILHTSTEESAVQKTDNSKNTQTTSSAARTTSPTSYSDRLSALIQHTDSLLVRLLLVLLLGILMSLTPCIYPMIPITVGILQSRHTTSLLRNFMTSLSYTLGIATTFAVLGLFAAATGKMFGTFMANPVVIVCIVALLIYLGLAMFGLYEMHVPKFLKSRSPASSDGSLLSAFLFGAASGSVASPCLSPGLVVLLSMVTKLNNPIMGFMLLFVFGVGLSLPLLCIGTFSSSLTMLPRAGIWMVEVKKIFGFILFGMCFYFVKPIVPAYLLLSMIALFLFIAGIAYLYWRLLYGLVGIILIAASVIVATQAYKAYLMVDECTLCSTWQKDYAKTMGTAALCKKKVFVDVGATFCSLCTAIDTKVLAHPDVVQALHNFCCVKINGADDPEDVCQLLQKQYGVVGFPTFLLIDAQTGNLIKRWAGELYDVDAAAFAQELKDISS